MERIVYIAVVLSLLVGYSHAHSWLQCADYSEENGNTWDAGKCRGYGRGFRDQMQYATPPFAFGGDGGYDYRPSSNQGKPCRPNSSPTQYTSDFPRAKYNPGQKVCLAWPPKNHVAAACKDVNNPDHGTWIYRSGKNPSADPTLAEFKQNQVAFLGKNTGTKGEGFQNCPNFCEKNGDALCSGCFTVPSDLEQGSYTFLWYWAYNNDDDLYTTCFDVDIVADSGNTILTTLPKYSPDEYKAAKAAGTAPTPAPSGNGAVTSGGSATTAAGGGGSSSTAAGGGGSSTGSTAAGGGGSSTAAGSTTGTCAIGSVGCACTSGGGCDPGLNCQAAKCVNPKACELGALNCDCTPGKGCDPGLMCSSTLKCTKSPSLIIGNSAASSLSMGFLAIIAAVAVFML